jgi:hypothetical protein
MTDPGDNRATERRRQVRCKILVDGRVSSTAAATGSYNIASREVSKDPLSGKWSDSDSG